MEVKDTFLNDELFNRVLALYNSVEWTVAPVVENSLSKEIYFINQPILISKEAIRFNNLGAELHDIFAKLLPDFTTWIRIKLNLIPATEKIIKHTPHQDYPFKHKGAVFMLNNCDGKLNIEGNEIETVANRVVLFDPSTVHYTTTCTDANCRSTINFNYF
jgi:hypothetical protein